MFHYVGDPKIIATLNMMGVMVNAVSALVVIFFMQKVTPDAGWRCELALIQLVQRAFYVALSGALMWNAMDMSNSGRIPDVHDFLSEGMFFLVCIMSVIRHMRAPPIPPNQEGWRAPAMVARR